MWYLLPFLSPTNATMESAHLASWPAAKNFLVATRVKKGLYLNHNECFIELCLHLAVYQVLPPPVSKQSSYTIQVSWPYFSSKPWVHTETDKKEKGKAHRMYTWNTVPTMQRGGFGAMLWAASWPRTRCTFLGTTLFYYHLHSLSHLWCVQKSDYVKHIIHFLFLQMPCCKWRPFPCENLCGNPLLCGNHYCTKSCHVLEIPLNQPERDHIASISKANALAEPCEQCNLPCQRVSYSFFVFKNFCLVCFTKLNMVWRSYCAFIYF